jgi:uncharacterized iron-regulated protein
VGAALGLGLLVPCQWALPGAPGPESAEAHDEVSPGDSAPETAFDHPSDTTVLDLTAVSDLAAIIPRLASKRVVFVSEAHDRFDHHLNQLAIIEHLHAIHPDLAIGLEVFERGHQQYLDAYVAGELGERELLKETGYYDRRSLDFRLYAPTLRFAKEHGIAVVALNFPLDIVRKVAREGLQGLSAEEEAQLPADMDRSVSAYREHLRGVFEEHPEVEGMTFENFVEAQLLWDEGMAERAATYLEDRPEENMVILAGLEHIAYGRGVPMRLMRRLDVATAIVLNGVPPDLRPGAADFVLLTEEKHLPTPGRLGVALEIEEEGLKVASFSSNSAAIDAGMKEGDFIVAISDFPISDMRDLRVEMWDKAPGDKVAVKARRKHPVADEVLVFEIELR